MLKRISLFIMLLFLFGGCSAKNVNFFDVKNTVKENKDSNNTVRLYVDAFGNLYPDEWLITEYTPKDKLSGSLYNFSICDEKLCSKSDKNSLCKSVNDVKCKDKTLPVIKGWTKAQDVLWKKAGKKILEKVKKGNKDRNLLFLIHGFDNTAEEAFENFSTLKDKVCEIASNNKIDVPLFVEIYWDGFHGSKILTNWKKAQSSGPLVGFKLRLLLKEIRAEYNNNSIPLPEIEVLTHSSGAFVAGALFGNPYIVQPLLYEEDKDELKNGNYDYVDFRGNRKGSKQYPIPNFPISNFPEIRIAMIAAATPYSTFNGGVKCDDNFDEDGGLLSKNTTLFFSINSNDHVVDKHGLKNFFGATGAGADKKAYCKTTFRQINKKDETQNVYAFDFKSSINFCFEHHKIIKYFEHDNTEYFIEALLGVKDIKNYITCCPKKE